MKTLFLFLILIATTSAYSQRKGKNKAPAAPNPQTQIDSLTKTTASLSAANKSMTAKSDSLSKELEKYFGLYTVIKDKVVKMDFNPAKMSHIIDSLRAGRDSAANLSGASGVLLRDSIKVLSHANDSLKKETEGLKYAVNLLRGGTGVGPAAATDFTGTWNLVLRKVKVIGQPTKTGVVDAGSDPVAKTAGFLEQNSVSSISFIDKEFAELTFSNGTKSKCLYSISEFNKTKPYYVDFKGTQADFRMYFTNTVGGTRVSFQIPGVESSYYFGQITR
jgi:hypothetical protein